MRTLHSRKSIGRSPLRRGFLLIPLALACLALSSTARAVLPPPAPDGGYPNENTAEGTGALFSVTTGRDNTAIGFRVLQNNTGSSNTAIGALALQGNTVGNGNIAAGFLALVNNTSGSVNIAIGTQTLEANRTADGNIAIGIQALLRNTTGLSNIGIGEGAGENLTTGNWNIDIGNFGIPAEANTIRIGNTKQTRTFIAGIHGVAVTGSAVLVSSGGQLGVGPPSSVRFKNDIKPMDKASEAILALKPVTFRYKKELDPDGTPQFGLVAEEVEKINPALVTRDADGKVFTVRYEAVNAMLLNEFLKEHSKVEKLEATAAHQQKQIEALTAGLQKVSAQVQMNRPAPQLTENNQ